MSVLASLWNVYIHQPHLPAADCYLHFPLDLRRASPTLPISSCQSYNPVYPDADNGYYAESLQKIVLTLNNKIW